MTQRWKLGELRGEAQEALARGAHESGESFGDRVQIIKASEASDPPSAVVVGVSALPPGFRRDLHSHANEEVRIVLSGRGVMDLGDGSEPMNVGDVLLTGAFEAHAARPVGSRPLVLLWLILAVCDGS